MIFSTYRVNSGSATGISTSALFALSDYTVEAIKPMDAAAVPSYVQTNAGLGIVN